MKDSYLHIRIDSYLKEEAQERANSENRDLSNYIETLIKKDLA